MLGPVIEVIGHGDRARGTRALTNGEVLGKGGGTLDRRLIGTHVGAGRVGCPVGFQAAYLRNTGRATRVAVAVIFDDVILL